jgi:SecY interacting protein Syd
MSVVLQLSQLHQAYEQKTRDNTQNKPLMMHDDQWPSPCEVGSVDENGYIQWQAVKQQPQSTFDDLANALEINFPVQLNELYGTYYAGNIVAHIDGHQVELMQVWSKDDFDLLQQNITGHVLMKRKLKQPETVFIGLTDKEDLLVTVLIHSGEVCLEYVGKKTHHVLAPNIDAFLAALEV